LTFSSEFEWESLKLFERETQILKTLSHPTIPKYLNSFELDEQNSKGFALVQTYIEAPSLESQIKSGRTFSEIEIKQIAESLLETLIYLHGQHPPVIHRDIKPSNVLLTNRSGNYVGQTYLVDFGSVQTVASKNSSTFTVVGTYGYMPPEQFSGRTTPVSDLYSLGVTLIYIITGQHPADLMTDDLQLEFEQSTTLSPELTRWLRRMVQSAPSKRFANAREALQALKNPQAQNLRLPVAQPVGSQITIQQGNDQLYIQLPHNYLVSSDQLSQFLEMGTGAVGLALFVMIFTASPWHIVSFIVFIYLCDVISEIRSYKILINDEKISFQALLMSFKLKTWSYRKEDIHRLAFGKQPLKGWAQTMLPVEHQHYQVILNIGAKPYVIHAQNEIEISWLAHEFSKHLNLPLTSLTTHEPTDKSIASQSILQSSQILQPATQQTVDRVSLLKKPENSKIQLEKCDEELRIRLLRNANGSIDDVILFLCFFSVITLSVLVLSGSISLATLISSGVLNPFGVAWLCFLLFVFITQRWELHEVIVNRSHIIFKSKLYGFSRTRSYPRAQVSHLDLLKAHHCPNSEGGTEFKPGEITIAVGALSFKINNLSDTEEAWLSQALSEVLNVPIKQRPLIKS
jgi:serine/threonine protein kinase